MNSFTNDEKQAVYKAIYGRRDVRTFLSDEIPNETVYNILQAAHSGPSVGFMQPWNFILVSDTEVKNKLAWAADKERRALAIHYEGEKKEDFLELKIQGLKEAPLTICVTCDPTRGGSHGKYILSIFQHFFFDEQRGDAAPFFVLAFFSVNKGL